MTSLYRVTGNPRTGDAGRVALTSKTNPAAETQSYRSPWQRDYDRILHSPSFRRLQGKTQLFPGLEVDFFRSRLTHSVEVAQIGKSIVLRLNAMEPFFKNRQILAEIVEAAALAHDLGHPPFGHNGEDALDTLMRLDSGGFEGNAQTLRIVARLEKYQKNTPEAEPCGFSRDGNDHRFGLNLTFRTMAAVLKYDTPIPITRAGDSNVRKGYYYLERSLVNKIKTEVLGGKPQTKPFKTIECHILDIADDIAYSCYDLEDALKAGFVSLFSCLTAPPQVLEVVAIKTATHMQGKLGYSQADAVTSVDDIKRIVFKAFSGIFKPFFHFTKPPTEGELDYLIAIISCARYAADDLAADDYKRNAFISDLVSECICGVEIIPDEKFPPPRHLVWVAA